MFKSREEAGKMLAEKLSRYAGDKNVVVLALPRGGVVLGAIVAHALRAPLDIIVPRKIGAPGNHEYAIGALTETGETIFNEEERRRVDAEWLAREVTREKAEALRRLRVYRGNRPALDLVGKTVIIVDDGIATGLTMRAAIASVRTQKPARVVVGIPVAAQDSMGSIRNEVDELVVLNTPLLFGAVGAFYEQFPQVQDEEVISLLKQSRV